MAAEVVSLAGGGLYVGGDIDHVVFSYYSGDDHEAKVRWMGECYDVEYYVAQKARIGMVGCECVDVYDPNEAADIIAVWLADVRAEREDGPRYERLVECLTDLLENVPDSEDEVWNEIWKADPDFATDGGSLRVLSARVYYAHAALARLCELLDKEKR